jgi:ribosomal protein S6--L-glutamate ligase
VATKSLSIGILSRNSRLYSTRKLVQACKDRGHSVEVIDPLKCYMDITSKKPMIKYKDRTLDGFEAIIPRIGASVTFYGTAILRQFEMMGVYPLNESSAISRSRDKLRALQILSQRGLGLPRTGFAHSTKMTENLIELVGGAPLVVKLLEGAQGKGVVLAENNKAAEALIEAFREMNANFLVQEFVKEALGTDLRCLVIGDKVVASMLRRAKEGEFRSNLHRGGAAESVKITPKERETAVKAVKALGLNVAGVDMLRAANGPSIMEVNSSPGLEGIEATTKKDVAAMIIQFIEKKVKEESASSRARRKG